MPRDEKQGIESVDEKLVYTGHAWHLVTDVFMLDGVIISRDYIRHPGAVAVVAVDDNGDVLMVHQYRRSVDEKLWELPAGYRDEGEEPLESAKRELLEEAGMMASDWKPLLSFYTTPGTSSELTHVYVASGLTSGVTDFVRDGEEAEMHAKSFPLSEVLSDIASGHIHNVVTVVAVLAYARTVGE